MVRDGGMKPVKFSQQKVIRFLKLVRRALRRARVTLQYGSLSGSPILFANSFPKSGTHLLTQVLQGFAKLGPAVDSGLPAILTFDGPTGNPRLRKVILKELRDLKAGDIAYGHLHATPEVLSELSRDGIAAFFIYRDPRDVVVSHVHYVTEMEPGHVHHSYYANELKNFNERLKVSILGRPDLADFPDVFARFEPYLPWLNLPEVLPLRYEDFVLNRSEFLSQIVEHAVARGFRLQVSREEACTILDGVIDPMKSPTFRSGKTGKWRESFTQEHKTLFKKVAGDLLVQLGYEISEDW